MFSATFKVYSTVSTRRFVCDLKDAHQLGYVTKPIHYNSICAYLESPRLTPVLSRLIVASALPLRAVEDQFAIDSSGFSSSKFVRWFDEKYGVTRQKHAWIKVHLACGVNTHVVTAVRVLDRDSGDSPQFAPLVKATRENFTIREVSADKAYGSVENFDAVAECGGTAYIAFRENTTGGVGGLFEKMFHYYQYRRDDFLAHYHKRSNVESVFSAIKRKFGDSVRSPDGHRDGQRGSGQGAVPQHLLRHRQESSRCSGRKARRTWPCLSGGHRLYCINLKGLGRSAADETAAGCF